MTIRNLEAFIGGLWNWAILKGCFGMTRIEPTDVDGLVERNGHFLILEAKGPGVMVKRGQMRMFEALQRTGYFTVVVVWGNPDEPEKLLVMTPKQTREFDPAGLSEFRNVVSQWFVYAERQRGTA